MQPEKQNFIQRMMNSKISYPANEMARDRQVDRETLLGAKEGTDLYKKRNRGQQIDDENFRLMDRYNKEIPEEVKKMVEGIGLVESNGGDPMYRQGDKHLRNTSTGDNSAYGINQIRPIYLKESMRSAEKHDFRLPVDIKPEELQGERRDYIQRMMTAKQIMDHMEKKGTGVDRAIRRIQNPGDPGYVNKVKAKLAQLK